MTAQDSNPTSGNEHFQTSDLPVIAYLKVHGIEPSRIDCHRQQAVFSFARSAALENALDAYFSRAGSVVAMDYAMALRTAKALAMQVAQASQSQSRFRADSHVNAQRSRNNR